MHAFTAIALLVLSAGTAAAAGPPPDLTGRWRLHDSTVGLLPLGGGAIPLLPDAAATYRDTRAALRLGRTEVDSMARCLPAGTPRIFLQPRAFLILQRPAQVTIFFEHQRMVRRIYLRAEHGDVPDTLFMGHSIGHWDGDTLVVDSDHFKDSTFLDDNGLPHSADLHLLERFRMLSPTAVEDRILISDPKTFSRPWKTKLLFDRQPDLHMQEDLCSERLGLW